MKIQILDNAKLDLVDGFDFYENQIVLVHAVLDRRQDPESMEQRLNEERTRRWT